MSEIKKGDQVMLKSGGPLMTVQDVGDYTNMGVEDGALCVWFDRSQPQEKVFSIATLEIHEEEL